MASKEWFEKDFYRVLGVSKTATPDEIKKAFRKIARENHPDKHPGDAKKELRFKEASEANSVLSDPQKRKEYDAMRSGNPFAGFGGGAGGFGGGFSGASFGGVNVEELLRGGGGTGNLGDLFGDFLGGGRRRGAQKGNDVEGKTTIDFLQSLDGTTVSLTMATSSACSACRGTGAKAGTNPRPCPTCMGSGASGIGQACATCGGRGLMVDDPCPSCHGSGHGPGRRTVQARIPSGVADGQRIRIRGQGGEGSNGGANGDLYLTVSVRPHPVFGRDGNNLTVTLPVTFPEAALGADVDVPLIKGGTVRLRIPPLTANGRVLRVRGAGVDNGRAAAGDLLVTISVTVPTTLTDEAQAALRTYATLVAEPSPRGGIYG